jgi:anti-sigma regulatory factor (Ser/Thr protein kinase)
MLAAIAAAETHRFQITPDAISEMDSWIEGIGQRWGIDPRVVFRARVCISELAANVLEHGRITRGVDTILVELRHRPPGIEIEFSDPGTAFDLVAAAPIEPKPERAGGRGLRLVRSYAQKLTYCRSQNRNVISLQLAPIPG